MMPIEEKTMKIKAKFDDVASGYKEGEVFEAKIDDEYYYFTDRHGDERYRHEEEFTLIPDEPAIEVGSVWVSQIGAFLTVDYVGKHQLICTWNETGKEFASSIKNHLKFYKPKPKTVTMYFYQYGDEYTAYSEPLAVKPVAFTREIELP